MIVLPNLGVKLTMILPENNIFYYGEISTYRIKMPGIYLVTVPIGNSQDITLRALNALKDNTNIYCEDTRMFKDLCRKTGVEYSDKRIVSFHDHSDEKKLIQLIEKARVENCLFVSDAGSPMISDPAFPIVKKAIELDVPVHSLGGISAVTTALELSGLPPIPFHFHGFLARDKGKRSTDFATIHAQYGTHILFEGVSRVLDTLAVMVEEFPDCDFVVGRELTKEFESVYRFKASEFDEVKNDIFLKGEFVILLYNSKKDSHNIKEFVELANQIITKGTKPKLVSKLLSAITGESSKEIYQKLSIK
jgi:16S rRNA (cytidine1402-2'-O)-methyltransferase